MDELRVKDILRDGTVEEISAKFAEIQMLFLSLEKWVVQYYPKSDPRMVLERILNYASVQCQRLSQWSNEPIDQIAWATRNLYECDLNTRHLLLSESNENFLQFM